jgi:hypothetical protein
MAKKSQVPPTPEMTQLPISPGDSPLVIDLPDGQKLVVGNLAAGSVIEVATWRGTGRPDSRTSRLMLGMSTAAQKPAENAADEKKVSVSSLTKVSGIFKALQAKAASRKSASQSKKSSAPLIETVSPPSKSNDAAQVDDWLNSILEKSAKKQAQASKSEVKPAVKAAPKKAVTKKSAPKKSTTGRKR